MPESDAIRIEMAERSVAKTLRMLGYSRDTMSEIREDSVKRKVTLVGNAGTTADIVLCCLFGATQDRLREDGIRSSYAIRKDDFVTSVA